jgi:hypothetical protein
MVDVSRYLRPTDREILDLALRETDPGQASRFESISRGPLFALVAIPLIVLVAIPSSLLRLLRGWLRSDADRAE